MEERPWWRKLLSERRRFVSPLARGEVVRRLGESVDPMFSPFGARAAQGTVKEDRAVVRRRIRYRNSFQTMARMTFHDQGTGTRIEAEYGMALAILVFAAAMALVVIGTAVGFFAARRGGEAMDDTMLLPFMLFPIVFLVGFTLTALFVRSAARADKAFLDDFIKTTLDAKEA
jgi:hypothetical protein